MGYLFQPKSSDVPPGSGPSGWLYVLTNYAMPGYVKIGYSCSDLWERVRQLQSQTANPGIFIIESYYFTESVERHEQSVFEVLAQYRIRKQREFFVGSAEFAYYTLKEYFDREPDWIHPRLAEALQLKRDGLA
jgi:hypothetical protein